MAKHSLSKQGLPEPVASSLQQLGHQVRRARKRKHLSKVQFSEQLQVHVDTVTRLEKGDPGLGIGILLTAFWLLDKLGDFDQILNELNLPPSVRIDNDF